MKYKVKLMFFQDLRISEEKEQSEQQNWENQYEELQKRYQELEESKIVSEQNMKHEIHQLKSQVFVKLLVNVVCEQ